MIVVGYLYNTNGMATWCLEAAQALYALNEPVVLVKSPEVTLPVNYPVPTIDLPLYSGNGPSLSFKKKIIGKIEKYVQILPRRKMNTRDVLDVHRLICSQIGVPQCYLFNQTSFVSSQIAIPQFVVAWSYKPTLKSYLSKAIALSFSLSSLKDNLYNAFYWYKMDTQAYSAATGVLSVSKALTGLLTQKGISAFTIYPGLNTKPSSINEEKVKGNKIRFLMMAIDLEDNRKGLRGLISLLKKFDYSSFELVLIGDAGIAFKRWVEENGFPSVFTGLLPRPQALEISKTCDVLLFGSVVDDWGYVQVEAMSHGMIVLSPDKNPFDEIIGRKDFLFKDEHDLEMKLKKIISHQDLHSTKDWFRQRYQDMFSSNVFGHNILKVIR